MATISERVKRVTAEQLGVDAKDVTPKANFVDDLGADSLDLVELILSLEKEFSDPNDPFEIPDEDAEKILTVKDAVDYIKDKGVKDS